MMLLALLGMRVDAYAAKADKEPVKHLVNIPVFFITDRNREPCQDKEQYAKFGRMRQYNGVCNHDPHIGIAYCAIDNTQKKPIEGKLTELGWQPVHKHVEGAYSVTLIDGCTYEEAKDRFYDAVYKKALIAPDRDVFVFAPGYMSTFESGLKEAARFAYYAERPVVLYSWPSKGRFKDYGSDAASVEWSQDHYNEMISELADLAKLDPAPRMRLLAHSMGSRLLMRAIPLIHEKNVFHEIAFVCPDVDDGVVKHYVRHCLTKEGKATCRLYMSHKDEMLKLSQIVHGGYARLGEEQGVFVNPSPYKKAQISTVDVDISPETLKRFQTIDFTDMDEGTLGHKIPVELICSMSLLGKPPASIEIEHKKKGQVDCSDVMLDIASLGPEQDIGTVGYFKVKQLGHNAPILHAVRRKLPVMHTFIGKDWTMK